jgi:hypothetical protein
MGKTTNELIAIAYPENTGEVEPLLVEVDPYVARLDAVLAAKELTDEERGTVRAMLDLILPPLEGQVRSRRRRRHNRSA